MSNIAYQPLGEPVKDPTPAPHPSKTLTITGKYVTLEPLSPSHAPGLFPVLGGPSNQHLWTYIPYDQCPNSPAELTTSLTKKSTATDSVFYTIFKHSPEGEKTAVGYCAYINIVPHNRCLEIGHVLFSRQLQKSVAATEAMYLMARQAFSLGYVRYEWKCHGLNQASRKAAERLGCTYEGCFRRHLIDKHGRNRDTMWFSIVEGEWEGRRQALEKWLEASNFDGEGRQRRRLEEFREGW